MLLKGSLKYNSSNFKKSFASVRVCWSKSQGQNFKQSQESYNLWLKMHLLQLHLKIPTVYSLLCVLYGRAFGTYSWFRKILASLPDPRTTTLVKEETEDACNNHMKHSISCYARIMFPLLTEWQEPEATCKMLS